MAGKVAGLNPSVLLWARARSGLSVEQVAEKIKRAPAEVAAWESGDAAPTYVQLEKLSYQVYHRPLAIFFFPAPPDEPEAKGEFRLIPETEVDAFGDDALFAVRQARASQESLRELTGGRSPVSERIIGRIDPRRFRTLESLCKRVRESLGIALEQQTSWESLDQALKEWRAVMEDRGVFVFKRPFKQDDISGFCLYDSEFPVIYINNSTSQARQIFTLFHELAHLLYRSSGVTKGDASYVEALPRDERDIEVRCNQFAGVFLVPDEDFGGRSAGMRGSDPEVEELASHYNVSRETILRKFLDRDVVGQRHYERKTSQWNVEWKKRRDATSGGDYYRNQAIYLSNTYTRLAFNGYYEGRWSIEQLGEYLGIKAKNVETFETYLTAV